jgi:hypothetical protein
MAKPRKNPSASLAGGAARKRRVSADKKPAQPDHTRGTRTAIATVSAAVPSLRRPANTAWALPTQERTCTLLKKYLGARAGTEALLHAFLASRECDGPAAQFWIGVYQMIVETRKPA